MNAGLIVAFVALTAVLLWSVIGGRGPWWLKLPLVVAVPALSLLVHHALAERAGWPTSAAPPKTAQFLAGYAQEPDVATHSRGAIFLYLLPAGAAQPRSYRLPYSRPNHEQLEQAGRQAKHGPVGLKFTRTKGGRRMPRWAFRAYRLPAPSPPLKHP